MRLNILKAWKAWLWRRKWSNTAEPVGPGTFKYCGTTFIVESIEWPTPESPLEMTCVSTGQVDCEQLFAAIDTSPEDATDGEEHNEATA